MGRRSLLAWCRGDPGAAPSFSVVVDAASSARNSARSSETRCPRAIASAAVTLSHGWPTRWLKDLATALPDPAGTTPTGNDCATDASVRVMSPLNTSARVPSPPTQTIARYASRSSDLAIFMASPLRAVTRISTTTPHPLRAARTGATSRSYAATPRPFPAAGFTSTRSRAFVGSGSGSAFAAEIESRRCSSPQPQRFPCGMHRRRMSRRAVKSSASLLNLSVTGRRRSPLR